MAEDDKARKLESEIAGLEERLVDLKARLPAHSIPPGMIAELDELDEVLDLARARLSTLQGEKDEE
jgi:hypothetical protein